MSDDDSVIVVEHSSLHSCPVSPILLLSEVAKLYSPLTDGT